MLQNYTDKKELMFISKIFIMNVEFEQFCVLFFVFKSHDISLHHN